MKATNFKKAFSNQSHYIDKSDKRVKFVLVAEVFKDTHYYDTKETHDRYYIDRNGDFYIVKEYYDSYSTKVICPDIKYLSHKYFTIDLDSDVTFYENDLIEIIETNKCFVIKSLFLRDKDGLNSFKHHSLGEVNA